MVGSTYSERKTDEVAWIWQQAGDGRRSREMKRENDSNERSMLTAMSEMIARKDESDMNIIRPTDRPKGSHTQMVRPYSNPIFNIRNYPFCISIQKFKVEFL
jgi:hypothetical protein